MAKKLDLNYVKTFFEQNNCTLLDNNYVNNTTKMRYICTCGSEGLTSFKHFKRGVRCSGCRYERAGSSQSLSYDNVREFFEQHNCTLLSNHYRNNAEKLKFRCRCGNIGYRSLDRFQVNPHCKECGLESRSKKRRLDLEEVKSFFEENGCELQEKEYVNSHHKMRYKCSCGNESVINYSSFKQGRRCYECGLKKIGDFKRTSFEEVKLYFEENNCELLESSYENNEKPLRYICECGKENVTHFSLFKRGARCYDCGIKKISGTNHYMYKDIITDKERIFKRNFPEYREWRKKVLERDDYTCKCCGDKESVMVTHHIKNYLENEELRTELKNGITLCQDCHLHFHKKYGFRGNNEKQLDEFIKEHKTKAMRKLS